MTFRRTSSALFSLTKFFKVDVIVFCEGGDPVTLVEAMRSDPGVPTLDLIFWKSVVALFRDPRRFHFKSVGSKTTLTSIAADIEANNFSNVTVCRDSDYDRLLGRDHVSKRTAYTFGYSWENDVLSESVTIAIMGILIGPPPAEAIVSIRAARAALERDLKGWCETDIELYRRGKPTIFDRKKPLSCVDLAQRCPKLKAVALRSRLQQCGYKRRPRSQVSLNSDGPISTAFGKLVSRLLYHTIVGAAKEIDPKLNLDYSNFMRLAISETFKSLSAGLLPDLSAHYLAQKVAF